MRRLEVRLDFGESPLTVGTLAERDRRVFFEYDPAFVDGRIELSPLRLPLRPGVHQGPPSPFNGLFGVFADSLPDGWGMLLMDRDFRQRGISRERVTPVDRLAYIGSRGMGALTYHPTTGPNDAGTDEVGLDELAAQAQAVLEGSADEVLPELLRAGGSPGGARPKVVVGYREGDGRLISGSDRLPDGYRGNIVKFGCREDHTDAGVVELAYARMAHEAGVEVPPVRLFTTAAGARYFGAARFDRPPAGRRHVHSLAGLLHADFRYPEVDYEAYLRATLYLTRDQTAVAQAFRRMVFNVLACNRDDHARNFAFLMEPDGVWHHTPAYDLTFSHGPGGEHTMAVAGEGRQPTRRHFADLAAKMGIPAAQRDSIIEQVAAAVARWPALAGETGVNPALADEIQARLGQVASEALAARG
ncbi:MAG TPA: type II toxin-antitoxin system HipA family toxin [Longimicrobium sp.]|nr:type II toxin-antitoxin system HipA family toxin [Longimicrobium sp.]